MRFLPRLLISLRMLSWSSSKFLCSAKWNSLSIGILMIRSRCEADSPSLSACTSFLVRRWGGTLLGVAPPTSAIVMKSFLHFMIGNTNTLADLERWGVANNFYRWSLLIQTKRNFRMDWHLKFVKEIVIKQLKYEISFTKHIFSTWSLSTFIKDRHRFLLVCLIN